MCFGFGPYRLDSEQLSEGCRLAALAERPISCPCFTPPHTGYLVDVKDKGREWWRSAPEHNSEASGGDLRNSSHPGVSRNTLLKAPATSLAANQPPPGGTRSWYIFGLLSLTFSLMHVDEWSLDRLVNPIEELLPENGV